MPAGLRVLIGDRSLLVPIEAVDVVIPTPPLTTVPGTPAILAGLFNYQGTIYAAIHPLPDTRGNRHAVIVRTPAHGKFALLCDWAEDLAEATAEVEPLDLVTLGHDVIASYAALSPVLPRPKQPRALVRLRPRRSE